MYISSYVREIHNTKVTVGCASRVRWLRPDLLQLKI